MLWRPVHPRACGERYLVIPASWLAFGSSPRLRGTGSALRCVRHRKRFIPAPAGNGQDADRRRMVGAVHPRACGERFRVPDGMALPYGSSPRLRGTGVANTVAIWLCRFIPAPAGNGQGINVAHARNAVHPRACGERAGDLISTQRSGGSSPRLRGTASRRSQHGTR